MSNKHLYIGSALAGGSGPQWENLRIALSVIGNIVLLWLIMCMCIFGWVFID